MRTRAWNLIVIPHGNSRMEQFHFSYKAIMILALAFVVSFLATVLFLLMHPQPRVNEAERMRLETENRSLKVANDNLSFQMRRLDAQVKSIEERSKVVEALMDNTE
jgi:hypothetical protein